MVHPSVERPIQAHEVDWGLLRRGVAQANIPALLMVLHQMSGEEKWLKPPYAPSRAAGLDDNDSGQLPNAVQDEIRLAAFNAVHRWSDGQPLAISQPTNAHLAKMLSVAMSEHVPEEYGDIIAAGMAFERNKQPTPNTDSQKSAVIIGAGISGICAAIELDDLGIPYTIFEKNEDFGGTWLENRYPGCGVDTPSLTYTFARRPNDWSKYFPLRDEIEEYLLGTARHFGLYANTRFNTRVENARWNEQKGRWDVSIISSTGERETYSADFLFSAVGILNVPKYPKIDGLSSFVGEVYHTSRWPEDAEIAEKRIAIIGNGASGMQVVPAIADEAKSLTIFARSKQWAAPFPQFHKDVPIGVRYLMQVVPLYRVWLEQRLSWTFNDRVHGTLFRDPEWEHPDRAVNAINDGHRRAFTRYVEEQLKERPDLIKDVLPDYPPFTKRMLLDNGWYSTIKKPNVTLIPEHLAKVDRNTLYSSSGKVIEADVIILATGFETTRVLGSYDVIGRNGRVIREYWDEDDAAAHLGTMVPGFPNFFILLGPNVGSGHGGSMIRNIESQMHYARRIIEKILYKQSTSVEVKSDVYENYRNKIDEAHEKLVWTHRGADNWYRNSKGRVIAITPWRNDAFWRMTRDPNDADFEFN